MKITLSHYTRGKYFGTDDTTVAWCVLVDGSPICAETNEEIARALANTTFNQARVPKSIFDWDGDAAIETAMR